MSAMPPSSGGTPNGEHLFPVCFLCRRVIKDVHAVEVFSISVDGQYAILLCSDCYIKNRHRIADMVDEIEEGLES